MRRMKLITTIITIAMIFFSVFSSTIHYSNAVTFEKFGPECNNIAVNAGHNSVVPSGYCKIGLPFTVKWNYLPDDTLSFLDMPQNLVSNGSTIYMVTKAFLSGTIEAIDKTGKKLASFDFKPFLKVALALGPHLYVGSDKELLALDLKTLNRVWGYKYEYKGEIPNGKTGFRPQPMFYKGHVIFHDSENLVCLKAENGNVVWKSKIFGQLSGTAIAYDDKIIYPNGDWGYDCFNLSNGSRTWRTKSFEHQTYLINSIGEGYFYAYANIEDDPEDKESGSPTPIYMYCVDMANGKIVWKYEMKNRSLMYPAVKDGKVITSNIDNEIHCVDLSTGSKLWSIELEEMVVAAPLIVDKTVILATVKSPIYFVNLDDGKIIGKYEADNGIASTMIFDDKSIYIQNMEGTLTCYQSDTDVEPAKITIDPSNARVKAGQTMQFNAQVFNKSGNPVKSDVLWSVNPTDIGTISKTGMFTAIKPGKGKISAKAKNAKQEVEIVVENAPPEYPKIVDFGEIEEGDEPTQTIEIKNNTKYQYKIKVATSYSYISVDKEELTIEPDTSAQLTIFPTKDKIEPGKSYKGKVLLDWGDGNGSIDFMVSKKKLAQLYLSAEFSIKLIDVRPKNVYSHKISLRNENKVEIVCKASSGFDWITFPTAEVTIPPKSDYEFEVKIGTEDMKNDQEKNGKFKLESKTGNWDFDVYVKTTKDDIPPPVEIQETSEATDQTEFEITGKTEKDAKVEIAQGDSKFEVTMDGESFKCKIMLLPAPSMNKFKLIATDPAGNATEKEITIINSHLIDVSMVVGDPIMYINGKATPINPPPTIIKGATMVPLRTVAEVFGCEVTYTNGLIQIKSKRGDNIILNLNSTGAIVNNNPKTCNPPPTLYKGKTMVPFRFIAEALGAQVSWEQSTKKIGMKLIVKP